jgi:hypothetical protein
VTADVAEATWRLASVVPGPLNNRMNLTVRRSHALLVSFSHGTRTAARKARARLVPRVIAGVSPPRRGVS